MDPNGAASVSGENGPVMGLVLLGRRRAGKSSVGNLILGRCEFDSGKKTSRCVRRYGWVDGLRLAVVDTPGWGLFSLTSSKRVKREILRSVMLAPPGGQMFLLVIPVDSFRKRDKRAVEKYLGILGDVVWSRTLVLFSRGDEMRGRSVEKCIQKEYLQEILKKCGQRYHVLNNCPEDFSQVSELLKTLKEMASGSY